MHLPEDVIEGLLRTWPVACLATRAPAGVPHVVPIVFVWWQGALWSPVDGKPKRTVELARVRHLRRDPRASVLLQRYTADWSQLWWLRLDGPATVVDASGAEAGPLEAALRAKYPQYHSTPPFLGLPRLLRLDVERRASWCASEAVARTLRDR